MYKYVKILIYIMICTLVLSGCSDIGTNTADKIRAPRNQSIPIKGLWEIASYNISQGTSVKNEEYKSVIEKQMEFTNTYILYDKEVYYQPQYKIKNVKAAPYFLYTHKLNAKEFGIKDERIEVITVTTQDKLFYEFIKLSENQIMVYMNDVFYNLTKISDEESISTPTTFAGKNKKQESKNPIQSSRQLRSGLLLGLRSPDGVAYGQEQFGNTGNTEAFYRTIWIAADNYDIRPILQMPNLFVPRYKDFWKVGIQRLEDTQYTRELLFAHPIKDEEQKKDIADSENYVWGNIERKIFFVGNNYMATEYGYPTEKNHSKMNKLQVLPLDHIENSQGVKISEILGEEGKKALMTSAQLSYNKDKITNIAQSDKVILSEDSFGITRRNGHWIMRGRLYLKTTEDTSTFEDFNINIIPPPEMVAYDTLHVSWNTIKEKVPKALDAYASPNKDIAVIVCKDEIYVYTIKNNVLSSKPKARIPIMEGESVVMAEWALDNYVDKWETEFIKEMAEKDVSVVN